MTGRATGQAEVTLGSCLRPAAPRRTQLPPGGCLLPLSWAPGARVDLWEGFRWPAAPRCGRGKMLGTQGACVCEGCTVQGVRARLLWWRIPPLGLEAGAPAEGVTEALCPVVVRNPPGHSAIPCAPPAASCDRKGGPAPPDGQESAPRVVLGRPWPVRLTLGRLVPSARGTCLPPCPLFLGANRQEAPTEAKTRSGSHKPAANVVTEPLPRSSLLSAPSLWAAWG